MSLKEEEQGDWEWEVFEKFVKRPKLVQHYFLHAGSIDHPNRYRMDGLCIKCMIEFKMWHKHLLSSIIGIIMV